MKQVYYDPKTDQILLKMSDRFFSTNGLAGEVMHGNRIKRFVFIGEFESEESVAIDRAAKKMLEQMNIEMYRASRTAKVFVGLRGRYL